MNWQLKSAAQYYILSDWSMPTKADYEWAEALALAMDRFARDWVKDNCAGRAIRALKDKP